MDIPSLDSFFQPGTDGVWKAHRMITPAELIEGSSWWSEVAGLGSDPIPEGSSTFQSLVALGRAFRCSGKARTEQQNKADIVAEALFRMRIWRDSLPREFHRAVNHQLIAAMGDLEAEVEGLAVQQVFEVGVLSLREAFIQAETTLSADQGMRLPANIVTRRDDIESVRRIMSDGEDLSQQMRQADAHICSLLGNLLPGWHFEARPEWLPRIVTGLYQWWLLEPLPQLLSNRRLSTSVFCIR